MLNINLLPVSEKKSVAWEELRILIKFFAIGLGVILVIGSVFVLPSFLPVYFERRELDRSLALGEEAAARFKTNEVTGKVKAVEVSLSSLKDFIQISSGASQILEGLLQEAGPGILLTNLSVAKGGDVVVTGHADTRNAILDFEKTLRDSGQFQNLSFPLSNIIREANISFTLEGKLKPIYAF